VWKLSVSVMKIEIGFAIPKSCIEVNRALPQVAWSVNANRVLWSLMSSRKFHGVSIVHMNKNKPLICNDWVNKFTHLGLSRGLESRHTVLLDEYRKTIITTLADSVVQSNHQTPWFGKFSFNFFMLFLASLIFDSVLELEWSTSGDS
jgi:hypothetical protein